MFIWLALLEFVSFKEASVRSSAILLEVVVKYLHTKIYFMTRIKDGTETRSAAGVEPSISLSTLESVMDSIICPVTAGHIISHNQPNMAIVFSTSICQTPFPIVCFYLSWARKVRQGRAHVDSR